MDTVGIWSALNDVDCSEAPRQAALCMLKNPWFYLVGVPTVIITGISKGGFGGVAMIAVPLLSLVLPPMVAAGIMLPILLVMDVQSVWTYRRDVHTRHLKILLVGAVFGIAGGYITVGWMNDDVIRLVLAAIVIGFLFLAWYRQGTRPSGEAGRPQWLAGSFWGGVSGYTSFLAHAGAPPMHIYLIPQQLEPRVFAATGALYFAIVNLLKLPPYLMTGQVSSSNILLSLALLPFAPLGVALGVFLNKRLSKPFFFRILYVALALVAVKLIFDGGYGLSGQATH